MTSPTKDDDLCEEVREWLVDTKYGLITPEELVTRADAAIRKLADPPDYLLSVSLGEPLYFVPRLDLLKDRVSDMDFAKLASRLLEKLQSWAIDLEKTVSVSGKVSRFHSRACPSGPWDEFHWIEIEALLIEDGVKDGSRFETDVRESLKNAAAFVYEQAESS